MRQANVCHRRERSSYSLCMKVSKFQIENKRKPYFLPKYRLIRCQNMTFEKKSHIFRLSLFLRLFKTIVNHRKSIRETLSHKLTWILGFGRKMN